MVKSEREVLRLLSDIYGAGLGERSWSDALEKITRFFGAAGAVAFDLDRSAGTIPFMQAHGVDQAPQGDYAQRMNAINPRMKRALAQSGCHTSFDYEALPEEAIRRHEFYDWLTRECGVKYFIGSRMIDAGAVSSFISIEFTARHGHAEPREIEMFRLLTEHIANAWRIARHLTQTSRIDDFNLLLMQNVPWGVVTLDHRGVVLWANGAAMTIIGRGDGLRIDRGRLHALHAADDRSLQMVIGRALATARGQSFGGGNVLAVGRRGAAISYGLRVLPMRCVVGPMPENVPFAAILISDPVQPRLPSVEDLNAIFGFTPREAEIARLAAEGRPVNEIARRIGVQSGTVRMHLANAMNKTGTHNQAALVGLIRGIPA